MLTYQPHGGPNSASLDVVSLLLSYLRTCYGMLPYAALTFLLVVVSRSAVVAVSGLILFMLAIELPLTALLPLLGKNYAQVAQFLPAGLAQAMNQQNYAAAHLPTTTLVSPFFVHNGVPDQQALALWIKHPGGYPAGYQPEFRAIVDRQGRVVVSSTAKQCHRVHCCKYGSQRRQRQIFNGYWRAEITTREW